MKVKKMKSGYTIRCSGSDFALLEIAAACVNPKDLSGDAKAAHTRRTKAVGANLLHVDVDNRK